MNYFRNYIREHRIASGIVFTVWFLSLIFGTYYAFRIKNTPMENIGKYVKLSISDSAGFADTFKSGIWSDFKFVALFAISGISAICLPLGVFLIGFKGFATGFSASVIIRLYGIKGMAATLSAMVLPLVFSLPLYFLIFVSGIELPFILFRHRGKLLYSDIIRLRIEYFSKIAILYFLLCIIVFFEALLSKYLWSVL